MVLLFLPSPPALRGRGAGGEGVGVRAKRKPPLTPSPQDRGEGSRFGRRDVPCKNKGACLHSGPLRPGPPGRRSLLGRGETEHESLGTAPRFRSSAGLVAAPAGRPRAARLPGAATGPL